LPGHGHLAVTHFIERFWSVLESACIVDGDGDTFKSFAACSTAWLADFATLGVVFDELTAIVARWLI
jgi:hypothetical protein